LVRPIVSNLGVPVAVARNWLHMKRL